MSPGTRKGCPRQDTPSLQLAHPTLVPVDPRDEIATVIDGVVVVVVRVSGDHYRRRCFLSVAAAEKAARRAQAAGHNATIYLAELKPLFKLAHEVAS